MCVLGCECMDNKGVLVCVGVGGCVRVRIYGKYGCVSVCGCQLVSERLTVGERERKKERVR